MNSLSAILLAVLSIWDYPARQPQHEALRNAMIVAMRRSDNLEMESIARKGVELLPDDPTWRYNLACAEAKLGRQASALDDLEKAIRLGFRDPGKIEEDSDFKPFADEPRFQELVDLADRLQGQRILFGPLATLPAKGVVGESFAVGAQNLAWDFESACFVAQMELSGTSSGGNAGDLYFNRDQGHSVLDVSKFPGLTRVTLDAAGRERGMDTDFPNMLFPCPVFGNCSRAMTTGPYWRSLPRALMTMEARRLGLMYRFYRANQIWVFPVVNDHPPLGKHGDIFASVTPYWIATQGRSWSDQYYLRAALEVSRSLPRETKREIVTRGLLAPTIQTLLRKSLRTVATEEDYLTAKAHPTAFPTNGLDLAKLKASASSLTVPAIPPVAIIAGVGGSRTEYKGKIPEITYVSPCAWAFVLRGEEKERTFFAKVGGGAEYACAQVHGDPEAARVEKLAADRIQVVIDRTRLTPSNRVDVAIFAKAETSDWGAPSFLSFAVVDPEAEYADPILTGIPPAPPAQEAEPPASSQPGARPDKPAPSA